MFRRIWLILLTLLAPILLTGFMIGTARTNQPSEQGKHILDLYLQAHQMSSTFPKIHFIRSQHSVNFVASMSQSSNSEGWTYQTTHIFPKVATKTTISFPDTGINVALGESGGLKALLYPPAEVWCVELTDKKDAMPTHLILAQHQDLYNAEWVVHELSPKTDQVAQVLAKLGCK